VALADTLTTRDALRKATLEDIVGRAEIAAQSIEGGPLDGIKVVSLGTLRNLVTEALTVRLPPPSDRFAEVTTPAKITTSALCPECDLPTVITVDLTPQLTVDDDGAEITVKAKTAKKPHVHNQLPLPDAEGEQATVTGAIEDHRLRILAAAYDIEVAHDQAEDPGPAPTLDIIARALEIAFEKDRGDLEDSLYSYSQVDPPLIEVVSVVGEPVTYRLTEDGTELVDASRPNLLPQIPLFDEGADAGEADDDQDKAP
jgi:hypothetical protein